MTGLAKILVGGACIAFCGVVLLATAVGAGTGFAEAVVREFRKNKI